MGTGTTEQWFCEIGK